MHISEGVLSPGVLIAGAALTSAGIGVGLRQLKSDEIPATGILSSAFFVASLIHVPAGPVSVHLVLNGLLGLMLGWRSFPAIFIGLLLQALLFQFGGLTSLGVNTLNMALPAVVCFILFGWVLRKSNNTIIFTIGAFVCGGLAVLLSGLMVGFSLYLTGEAFLPAAKLAVLAHFPVMVIEGALTAACLSFIRKVKPELLNEGI